jgi:hypothetical protein
MAHPEATVSLDPGIGSAGPDIPGTAAQCQDERSRDEQARDEQGQTKRAREDRNQEIPDPEREKNPTTDRVGSLERDNARLVAALDRLLPIVRAYLGVPPEQGGPDPDDLIDDPDAAGGRTLPEILEAERALFAASRMTEAEPGTTLDLAGLPEAAFLEASLESEPDEDPLVDAARRLIFATESIRARLIAGIPVDDDLLRKQSLSIRHIREALPPELRDGGADEAAAHETIEEGLSKIGPAAQDPDEAEPDGPVNP